MFVSRLNSFLSNVTTRLYKGVIYMDKDFVNDDMIVCRCEEVTLGEIKE